MTLEEYFEQPDTPSAGSPVGILMVRVLEKFPGISFEEARARANDLLHTVAGWKKYQMPKVLSTEEEAAEKSRWLAAVAKRDTKPQQAILALA